MGVEILYGCDNDKCNRAAPGLDATTPPLGWIRAQTVAHHEPLTEGGITGPAGIDLVVCSVECLDLAVTKFPESINRRKNENKGRPAPGANENTAPIKSLHEPKKQAQS